MLQKMLRVAVVMNMTVGDKRAQVLRRASLEGLSRASLNGNYHLDGMDGS